MAKKLMVALLAAGLAALFLRKVLQVSKYEWIPTVSAPKAYPVEVVEGTMVFPGFSGTPLPAHEIVSSGWGEANSFHAIGDDHKPVPKRLDVTWFSYAENKFYGGSWKLPKDKISDLFAAGRVAKRTNKRSEYAEIMVGLAPGGFVSVWLSAAPVTAEVAHFQAKEIQVDWKFIDDNPYPDPDAMREKRVSNVTRRALGEEGYKRLLAEGVPTGTWSKYRTPYNWSPRVVGGVADSFRIRTFSGEADDLIDYAAYHTDRKGWPVPREVRLEWKDSSGNRFGIWFFLDETEAFAAFETLTAADPKRPLELEVELAAQLIVRIKSADQSILLKNVEVRQPK